MIINILKTSIHCIPVIRSFSTSGFNLVNSLDGSKLDNTQEIADKFNNDREGIENYFREKDASIKAKYAEDVVSALDEDVPQEELAQWSKDHLDLLKQLSAQEDDAKDLADIPVSVVQDSSDIVQTDFTDSTSYED